VLHSLLIHIAVSMMQRYSRLASNPPFLARGVSQGDSSSGSFMRRFTRPAYADDEDEIFEEVLRHSIYPTEVLPTCRYTAGGRLCPIGSRLCRSGIAVLALTWAPLMFENDDNVVTVELDQGFHVITWCQNNLSLWGIEDLDPPLFPVPQDRGFFTVSTPNPHSYAWQALNPNAPGGNPSYEYHTETQSPNRIACIFNRWHGRLPGLSPPCSGAPPPGDCNIPSSVSDNGAYLWPSIGQHWWENCGCVMQQKRTPGLSLMYLFIF
jgi:hypothetical protein